MFLALSFFIEIDQAANNLAFWSESAVKPRDCNTAVPSAPWRTPSGTVYDELGPCWLSPAGRPGVSIATGREPSWTRPGPLTSWAACDGSKHPALLPLLRTRYGPPDHGNLATLGSSSWVPHLFAQQGKQAWGAATGGSTKQRPGARFSTKLRRQQGLQGFAGAPLRFGRAKAHLLSPFQHPSWRTFCTRPL